MSKRFLPPLFLLMFFSDINALSLTRACRYSSLWRNHIYGHLCLISKMIGRFGISNEVLFADSICHKHRVMFDITLYSWKMKLGFVFYLAWLSTWNSSKWSPCMLILIWQYPYKWHYRLQLTILWWCRSVPSSCHCRWDALCTSHTDSLATNCSLFHFPILWSESAFVWVWGRTGGRGGRPAWLRACARSGRDACERGGAGGWWWACRHAQTWSSPLSANLGRAELVKHTRARSPAQLPRHAHTHSD